MTMSDSDQDRSSPNDAPECPPPSDRVEIALSPMLDFPANPQLEAEGWQRRYMADPNQVKDAIRLYTELGFEVHTEAIQPSELSSLCGSCGLATCRAYVTIYTRKLPA
jgi:hypothetical protein